MMQILVVASTPEEIAPLIKRQTHAEILITGVGAPACLVALMQTICKKRYDFMIQAGIAGSFTETLQPGDCGAVLTDRYADLGIWENGQFEPIEKKDFFQPDEPVPASSWLQNPWLPFAGIDIPLYRGITVNSVGELPAQELAYRNEFAPHLESMEGAAFHHIALQTKIPFLQLRSISNYVGIREKAQWKIREAIHSLDETLVRVIQQLEPGIL